MTFGQLNASEVSLRNSNIELVPFCKTQFIDKLKEIMRAKTFKLSVSGFEMQSSSATVMSTSQSNPS